MKTRLGIFVFALLFLPLAGYWISGAEWNELSANSAAAIVYPAATLLTTLLLAGYVVLVNHLTKLLTGNNPLKMQRDYLLWMGAAGAMLAWSLVYLNLFVASWTTQPDNPIMQLLLYTPLFALLAPAVLSTRALLGSLPGTLKRLSHGIPLPVPGDETLVVSLGVIAVTGLLGGAAWPAQLLWQESTIFSGLKNGDWGRVVCAVLSGLVVGNLAVMAYQANGGILEINLPHPLLAQAGYALFGLLCLQLGDVLAEKWRGKQRGTLFRQKKKFPIPVVVKKN